VIVMASTAHAADPGDVEGLLREGVRLRREGRDVAALPLFEKAYAAAHTPRTSAQLGLVEFALGYSVQSAGHLSEALAVSNDVWIDKNRAQLEVTLANVQARIGDIVVTGSPEGAEVFLNDRSVGRLPLPGPAIAAQGSVMVELRAKGYTSGSSSVVLVGFYRSCARPSVLSSISSSRS
jgi:hypothetical protein